MTAVAVGDWGRIKGQHGKVSHLWLYPARVNPHFIAACGAEHPTAELVPQKNGERTCCACLDAGAGSPRVGPLRDRALAVLAVFPVLVARQQGRPRVDAACPLGREDEPMTGRSRSPVPGWWPQHEPDEYDDHTLCHRCTLEREADLMAEVEALRDVLVFADGRSVNGGYRLADLYAPDLPGWGANRHDPKGAAMSVNERLMNAANVRREGGRIRRGNGEGYADSVTSEAILSYLHADVADGNWEAVIFDAAVLDLRRREALAALPVSPE